MAHPRALDPRWIEKARELSGWMPAYLNLSDPTDEDSVYELARWLSENTALPEESGEP